MAIYSEKLTLSRFIRIPLYMSSRVRSENFALWNPPPLRNSSLEPKINLGAYHDNLLPSPSKTFLFLKKNF